MNSIVKKIFFLLPSILLLVLVTIFFAKDHQSFIENLKNSKPEIYSVETIESSISSKGFYWLQILFLILASSFVLWSMWSLKRATVMASHVKAFIKTSWEYFIKCLKLFSTLSSFQKTIVAIIAAGAIIHKVVLMFRLPLSNDEVFSYIYFIKQDFWITAIYYPEPNNHILFNLIGNFSDLLIPDATLCMRLPSLLFFIASLGLIFFFTFKNYGFAISIAALTLCAFSIGPAFYSIQGRGYMLMSFFAILAAFSIFEYLKNADRKFFIHLFVVASISGTYTIPIFLFPLTSMLMYALYIGKKETRRPVIIASLVIGISVLILYAPLISLNGWEALAGNKWVKAKSINHLIHILPAAIAESIDYVLGTSRRGYLIVLIFVLACLYLWRKNKFSPTEKNWIVFTLLSLLAIFLWVILLRNFPPYRAWTYLSLFFDIFLSIIIARTLLLFLKNQLIYLLGLLIGYAILMILQLQPDPKNLSFHSELNRHVKEIVKSDPKFIYIDKHELMESAIRFYCMEENKVLDLDISFPEKGKNYDYLIFYQSTPAWVSLKDYSHVFIFDQATVYKKIALKD